MYWTLFLAAWAYERNLLDTATDHFGRVEQLRYRVARRVYQDVLIGLALVTRARGEAGKDREYAAAARSFAIEMSDSYAMQISDSFQNRMAFLSGELRDRPAKVSFGHLLI